MKTRAADGYHHQEAEHEVEDRSTCERDCAKDLVVREIPRGEERIAIGREDQKPPKFGDGFVNHVEEAEGHQGLCDQRSSSRKQERAGLHQRQHHAHRSTNCFDERVVHEREEAAAARRSKY